jgi:hypothetical protein
MPRRFGKRGNKGLSAINKFAGKNKADIAKIDGISIEEEGEAAHSPLWVAVGSNKLAYSTNGTDWTDLTMTGVSALKDLTFGKNSSGMDAWYGCSTTDSKGFAYTTDVTDADSWSTVNPPGSGGGTAIEYSVNGTIIMGREHENYSIRRSTDYGITWVNSTIGNIPGNAPKATDSLATNGEGIWLAGMGTLGVILKSFDDGINWYKSADLGSDQHIGLEYANGAWVATEKSKTINVCTSVAESNTTDSWTQVDPPTTKTGDSITHITGSTWMVGGGRRKMWKSTDNASSWVQVTSLPNYGGSTSTNNNAYSLASDGTAVIATGREGYINISTDLGETWTTVHTMPGNQHMVSVEYNKIKPF